MNSLQDRRLPLKTKVHHALLKGSLHEIVKPSFLGWAFCSWHGMSGKNAWRHHKTRTCMNDHLWHCPSLLEQPWLILKSKHLDRLSRVRGLRPRKGRGIDTEGDLVLPLPLPLFDFPL